VETFFVKHGKIPPPVRATVFKTADPEATYSRKFSIASIFLIEIIINCWYQNRLWMTEGHGKMRYLAKCLVAMPLFLSRSI